MATIPVTMNLFEQAKTAVPKRLKLEPAKGTLVHTFPAHSFAALSVALD